MSSKRSPVLSRRSFLKAASITGAATLLPGTAKAAKSSASNSGELSTLLDISKCVGCGACVDACKESNEAKFPQPEKPFPNMYPKRAKVEDWSDKQDVDDRLTPYNWLYIQSADVEYNGSTHELHVPRRCLHCQNPPCADLCPFGAAARQANGVVRIYPNVCLGGAKCKNVCPWHIPQRQTGVGIYLNLLPNFAGNGVMYKCDRCYQLLEKGDMPACIDVCPEDVQKIGPREEIIKEAHALAKEINGFIYGEQENGGTNTIYVSPVPFDLLHKAVEKGKGKPGLAPVPDMMGREDNLVYATLLAPLAGIAGAALTMGSAIKKNSNNSTNSEADND